MKKKLNIFCACVIAAFLLSASGNVYMVAKILFINGMEIGLKAAQGEIIDVPQYKTMHVLPTDLTKTAGTITNLKDGKQLAIKPMTALIEYPYTNISLGISVLQGFIGFIVLIGLISVVVYFGKLMIQHRVRLDQRKTPAPHRLEHVRDICTRLYQYLDFEPSVCTGH